MSERTLNPPTRDKPWVSVECPLRKHKKKGDRPPQGPNLVQDETVSIWWCLKANTDKNGMCEHFTGIDVENMTLGCVKKR